MFTSQGEDPSRPWDGSMHPTASDAEVRRRMLTHMVPPRLVVGAAGEPSQSTTSIASSRCSNPPLLGNDFAGILSTYIYVHTYAYIYIYRGGGGGRAEPIDDFDR